MGASGLAGDMKPWQRYRSIVDDPSAFRAACQRPLPTTVRVNPIKATPSDVIGLLRREGITYTSREWNRMTLRLETDRPGRSWAYQHGWIHGQEEISQLPPVVLAPDTTDRIWAAAAAPGGKATQLAAMVEEGLVVANDASLGRLPSLRSNADRLGLTNLIVTHQDARNYSMNQFPFTKFDRCIVDAPCSGEGTLRKNTSVLTTWDESALEDLASVQVGILRRAVSLTKPGGEIVYSTCTFAPEENEAVVDRICEAGNAEVISYETPLEHSPGITEWQGEEFDPALSRTKRFYPHQNDTGGFYCAKLRVPT